MDIKVEVGKRLKQCRQQAGYTQKEAGKAINMSQPNYARYERGVYELNYSQLIILCNMFDISIDYLLGTNESN